MIYKLFPYIFIEFLFIQIEIKYNFNLHLYALDRKLHKGSNSTSELYTYRCSLNIHGI